ncbi:MAG: sugar kinase [Atopobiaceae bacterium]|jgi:sugar/nucleoside kinase (ribokinase family)
MSAVDVVCAGAAITDILLQPVSREIFDADSYPLDQIKMTIGGDAINESTIISRLGHKVALLSMVGDDAAGMFIQDSCRRESIDASGLKVDPTIDTSINVGLVAADGERTFVTNRNGSLWKTQAADFDLSKLEGARLLSYASIFNNPLVDGTALVGIFAEAKRHGLTICADMIKPRLGETLDDVREALGYLDFFFPNRDEAALLTGCESLDDIADAFLACGVKNVVIKNGRHGCFVKTERQRFEVPAVPGVTAVDTTGAGDNFVGGFITAILDGKPIGDCAKFANSTAAISVRSIGATTGVRDRRQVLDELAQNYD